MYFDPSRRRIPWRLPPSESCSVRYKFELSGWAFGLQTPDPGIKFHRFIDKLTPYKKVWRGGACHHQGLSNQGAPPRRGPPCKKGAQIMTKYKCQRMMLTSKNLLSRNYPYSCSYSWTLPGVLCSEHSLITCRLVLDLKKKKVIGNQGHSFMLCPLSPLTACVSSQHLFQRWHEGISREKEMILKNECPQWL